MRAAHALAERRRGVGAKGRRAADLAAVDLVLANLAYHDYEGVALRDEEKPRLVADLGEKNFLMLRNHGLLTLGRDIADAFVAMYFFETVCAIQVRAQAGGELIPIDPRIIDGAAQQVRQVTGGRGPGA